MKRAFSAAFAAIVAGLVALPAQAGPDRLAFLIGSHHVGATRDFEEINPGVFAIWEQAMLKNSLDIGVGAYRNSYGGASVTVTTALPIVRNDDWGFDLFGAMALYPGDGDEFSHSMGDVVPLIGAQARYKNLFMQAIPASGSGTDAVLSFGLTFRLN